jgi:hypothetical protein
MLCVVVVGGPAGNLVVKEVADMDELAGLLGDSARPLRVSVAQGGHRDARVKVKVLAAVGAVQVHAAAVRERHLHSAPSRHSAPTFPARPAGSPPPLLTF